MLVNIKYGANAAYSNYVAVVLNNQMRRVQTVVINHTADSNRMSALTTAV